MRALRSRHDRGAAAVEFALVLPLLLVLIFGLIDFGFILSDQIQVSSASRDGVRMVAMNQPGDAYTRASAAAPGLNLPTSDVQVVATCPSDPAPTDAAKVTVQYGYTFITPIKELAHLVLGTSPAGGDLTLSSTSAMRCGG